MEHARFPLMGARHDEKVGLRLPATVERVAPIQTQDRGYFLPRITYVSPYALYGYHPLAAFSAPVPLSIPGS